MASCTGSAQRTAEPSSSAACSRAGGGSQFEPSSLPEQGRARLGIRRELRLRNRRDFDAVFSGGSSWNNELLVLRKLPNHLPHNRFGFITSKRLGNAVIRNRVRRRLREIVRVQPLESGWDVVLSAKAAAARADFQHLKRAAVNLLGRAKLLAQDGSAGR